VSARYASVQRGRAGYLAIDGIQFVQLVLGDEVSGGTVVGSVLEEVVFPVVSEDESTDFECRNAARDEDVFIAWIVAFPDQQATVCVVRLPHFDIGWNVGFAFEGIDAGRPVFAEGLCHGALGCGGLDVGIPISVVFDISRHVMALVLERRERSHHADLCCGENLWPSQSDFHAFPCGSATRSSSALASASLSSVMLGSSFCWTALMTACLLAFPLPVMCFLMVPTGTPS